MIKYTTIFWLLATMSLKTIAQTTPAGEDFELVSLGRKVNSKYHDSAPVVSPDGKTLYFAITNHPENTFGTNKTQDIWCSQLDSTGTWSPSFHMPAPFNKNRYNQVLSIADSGNTLLLRGGSGKNDVGFSMCHQEQGTWQKPNELDIKGFEEMCQGFFNGAFMSSDKQVLIMYFSERPKSKYSDLYVSYVQPDHAWSRPQLISSLNTHMDEFGPYLSPDNKTMYFASNRGGGFGSTDVYKTQRLDDTWLSWSKPENIGAPVNTDGFDAYYAVSNIDTLVFTTRAFMSPDGGHLDIYSLKRIIKPIPKLFLSGYVYDTKTSGTVQASIRFEKDGEVLKIAQTYDSTYGEYRTKLTDGGKYILHVSAEGYLAASDSIQIEKYVEGDDQELFKDLYMKPIEIGLSVRLNNIFFDYNKATLRPESFPELDRVVEMLEQNPKLKIEIGGHTDDRGSDDYNRQLSQGRSEAVRTYLLEHFIEEDRVTAVGYGEAQPEVPNDSEDNMQINRRVAFTVLDMNR